MTGIEQSRVGRLPIWGWGVVSAAFAWSLYVLTLAPTTGFWDTSEYIATAHILGLPHPPGNPLFVLLGRVWETLTVWTGLGVARRINLLSATLSAGATFFWFLAMARIVAHFWRDPRRVLLASATAVLVGATAFTVWSQSNLNEKVYTVSLFVVALVSYLAIRWKDEPDEPRGDRLLLLIAFLLGLGASNHTMSLLPLPALAAYALWHRWRAALRPMILGGAALLFFVGFTVQLLFVPIRSAQDPIIDEADPECPSLLDAVIPARVQDRFGNTRWAVKCEALALSLIRDQYGKPPLSERAAPFSAQMANGPGRSARFPGRSPRWSSCSRRSSACGRTTRAIGRRSATWRRSCSPCRSSSSTISTSATDIRSTRTRSGISPSTKSASGTTSTSSVFRCGGCMPGWASWPSGRTSREARERGETGKRTRSRSARPDAGRRRFSRWPSFRFSSTTRGPTGRGITRRGTGPTTSCSRWSPTRSCSPTATTTPSRSGTSRRSKASGGT